MVDGLGEHADLGGDVLDLGLEPGQPVRERPPTGRRAARASRSSASAAAIRSRAPRPSPSERVADVDRARRDRLGVLGRGELRR